MIDVAMLRRDGIEQTVSALIDCSWLCCEDVHAGGLAWGNLKQCFYAILSWQR
jgi:hypothetical protein